MLPGRYKNAVIISKIPVMQAGLIEVISGHFPDYRLRYCRSVDELTLMQLRCADIVVADLTGSFSQPRMVCEQFYALLTQYHDIHWIFLVSPGFYSQAIEFLMNPGCTLLSDVEPIENLVKAIASGHLRADRVSNMLLSPSLPEDQEPDSRLMVLTLSERKVFRLLAKGWSINQIAMLLKKSNKTISAQKNSAMRRLSLHSNAEMYAWINSSQGARELNLPSVYGEPAEWKTELPKQMSRSSKSV
ncbi:TPA: LuxR C-terminal-related transcriptional regulator [Citrobacter freundii]